MNEFLANLGLNPYLIQVGTFFAINVILATSLNIINGYCGLFSLGHAGFYAVGAYASAATTLYGIPKYLPMLEGHPVLSLALASVAAMGAAGVAGLVIGIPCLRLTGDYLAIATIGFSEIIRIGLLNYDTLGASRGLPGIPELTNMPLAWIAAGLTVLVLRNLMKSSYGRCIIAVREDEIAARSMGVDVRFYKTFAFVVGSMFAGLAGALFAHQAQFLHPSNFVFMTSVSALLMIVIGGIGSQLGAIIGALVVTGLPEALRFAGPLSEVRVLVFGFLLIVMMLAKPEGIMGIFRKGKKMPGELRPKGALK